MIPVFLSALALFAQSGAAADPPELYYIVFLRPNPGRTALSPADAERIQTAHMANIHAMADRGFLVAAGPFEDDPPKISGIFVCKAASPEQAKSVASQDPTVLEHRNTVEVYAWRGPRGIGVEYARLHKQDPKTPEDMGVHPLGLLYRGSGWNQPAAERQRTLAAQDQYIQRLRRDGKLAAAGPVEGNDMLDSIVIFQRIPPDEAQKLLGDAPAVQAGILRPEFHRWWASEHVLPR